MVKKSYLIEKAEGIGRPLGTAGFVTELERRLGRPIAHRAPGRQAVAIPVGEQLNLLQSVSGHRISPQKFCYSESSTQHERFFTFLEGAVC
jgi:hypothetical protein